MKQEERIDTRKGKIMYVRWGHRDDFEGLQWSMLEYNEAKVKLQIW